MPTAALPSSAIARLSVLDTATGKTIYTLHAGDGENPGQTFSLAGDVAYTSGRDAVLRAWSTRTGFGLFSLPGVAGGAALPLVDGRVIVVDESDTVTVTDPRPRGEAAEVRTCSGFIAAGQLQAVGTMAVMGAACDAGDSLLYGIDLSAPKVAWTGSDLTGQHFALSADGTRVARQTLGTLGIEVDDAATGRRLRMLDGTCTFDDVPDPLRDRSPGCRPFPTAPFPFSPQDLRFSPDASVVVGIDKQGYLVAWDAVSGRILGTILPSGNAVGLLFTPDGREIVLGTDGGDMLSYSTASWQATREVTLDESVDRRLTPIGFADGGRTLLAVAGLTEGAGGWVYRLDATTFKVIRSVTAHTAGLKAWALSPDGTQVATAAADGSVRVWDVETLALEHELQVPGQAQGVAFVDETHLAVTPQSGDVLVMILDRDELLAKVRSTLTRGFTADECTQFGFGSACPTLDELRAGAPSP